MTRAHARLLGPCFKTGPVSARNKTTADRDASRPRRRRVKCDARAARGTRDACAPRSERGATPQRHGRLVQARGGREPRSLPSDGGRDTAAPSPPFYRRRRDNRTARSTAATNGSRCYTEGEVHALRGPDGEGARRRRPKPTTPYTPTRTRAERR
jgi:hypothetical protein